MVYPAYYEKYVIAHLFDGCNVCFSDVAQWTAKKVRKEIINSRGFIRSCIVYSYISNNFDRSYFYKYAWIYLACTNRWNIVDGRGIIYLPKFKYEIPSFVEKIKIEWPFRKGINKNNQIIFF